jgi:hypothetical protein
MSARHRDFCCVNARHVYSFRSITGYRLTRICQFVRIGDCYPRVQHSSKTSYDDMWALLIRESKGQDMRNAITTRLAIVSDMSASTSTRLHCLLERRTDWVRFGRVHGSLSVAARPLAVMAYVPFPFNIVQHSTDSMSLVSHSKPRHFQTAYPHLHFFKYLASDLCRVECSILGSQSKCTCPLSVQLCFYPKIECIHLR